MASGSGANAWVGKAAFAAVATALIVVTAGAVGMYMDHGRNAILRSDIDPIIKEVAENAKDISFIKGSLAAQLKSIEQRLETIEKNTTQR